MSCVLMSGSGQSQPIRSQGWWPVTNERPPLLIPGVVVASSTLEMGHTERCCCAAVVRCCWLRRGPATAAVGAVVSALWSSQMSTSSSSHQWPSLVTCDTCDVTWASVTHMSRASWQTRDTWQSCGPGEVRTTHPDLTDPVWWAMRDFSLFILDNKCINTSFWHQTGHIEADRQHCTALSMPWKAFIIKFIPSPHTKHSRRVWNA